MRWWLRQEREQTHDPLVFPFRLSLAETEEIVEAIANQIFDRLANSEMTSETASETATKTITHDDDNEDGTDASPVIHEWWSCLWELAEAYHPKLCAKMKKDQVEISFDAMPSITATKEKREQEKAQWKSTCMEENVNRVKRVLKEVHMDTLETRRRRHSIQNGTSLSPEWPQNNHNHVNDLEANLMHLMTLLRDKKWAFARAFSKDSILRDQIRDSICHIESVSCDVSKWTNVVKAVEDAMMLALEKQAYWVVVNLADGAKNYATQYMVACLVQARTALEHFELALVAFKKYQDLKTQARHKEGDDREPRADTKNASDIVDDRAVCQQAVTAYKALCTDNHVHDQLPTKLNRRHEQLDPLYQEALRVVQSIENEHKTNVSTQLKLSRSQEKTRQQSASTTTSKAKMWESTKTQRVMTGQKVTAKDPPRSSFSLSVASSADSSNDNNNGHLATKKIITTLRSYLKANQFQEARTLSRQFRFIRPQKHEQNPREEQRQHNLMLREIEDLMTLAMRKKAYWVVVHIGQGISNVETTPRMERQLLAATSVLDALNK
jgi:hypothetical protein